MVKKSGAKVRLSRDAALSSGRSADATKLMQILGLGLTRGTTFTVSSDDQATLKAVVDAIHAGLGDDRAVPCRRGVVDAALRIAVRGDPPAPGGRPAGVGDARSRLTPTPAR